MRTSNVHEFAGILEDFDAPAIEASDAPAPHHARRVREAADALRSLVTERDEALAVLRRLVDALPKCEKCDEDELEERVATLGDDTDGFFCDEHGQETESCYASAEMPTSAPLREAIALLERHGGGR